MARRREHRPPPAADLVVLLVVAGLRLISTGLIFEMLQLATFSAADEYSIAEILLRCVRLSAVGRLGGAVVAFQAGPVWQTGASSRSSYGGAGRFAMVRLLRQVGLDEFAPSALTVVRCHTRLSRYLAVHNRVLGFHLLAARSGRERCSHMERMNDGRRESGEQYHSGS